MFQGLKTPDRFIELFSRAKILQGRSQSLSHHSDELGALHDTRKIIGLVQAPATKIAGILQAPAGQLARVMGAYAAKDAA